MPTLRDRLRDASPIVPLKAAWRTQIRAARGAKRTQGAQLLISSRRAVEQALSQPVEAQADVPGLKDALRRLLAAEGTEQHAVAVEVDARVQAMIRQVTSEPVTAIVSGWPEWLTVADQARILGYPVQNLAHLTPDDAAVLIRELDGLQLGGATVMVQVGLPADQRLPVVPRGQRARPRARGTRPWLPFLDSQGRYSLTPQTLAAEHAKLLAPHGRVIDAFCGCGGDAIAMAALGLEVIAIEADPERLEMAVQNAEAKEVADRIQFIGGRAEDHLAQLCRAHRDAAVFLDPPWGGVDWDRSHQAFGDLIPEVLFEQCRAAPQILLKAPRALDPDSLPELENSWRIRPAWNPHTSSAAERVLFIRALARPE